MTDRARMCVFLAVAAVLVATLVREASAADLDWIRVSEDRRGFVQEKSGRPFVAWGFNYDHDETGRLIEDYWEAEWAKVVEDFGEMKALGANVVRIHLQVGKFLDAADKPNQKSLEQLAKLVTLAEKTGLYLDLTGLACYHKKDVPAWYDALDEARRWQAQAKFWEAIAATCKESPAIFCYDLMNEPVSPASDKPAADWLGPALGDKHFVQYISRERNGRERPEIARLWIHQLVAAIRQHDRRHMVTLGLVPWSLDKPGLTSGFVPAKCCEELDFVAVHLYPESKKLSESLDTLKGFAIGKPVIVEEVFPLGCSAEDLGKFMDDARPHCAGWIGFYWGKTQAEYEQGTTIADAITAAWLKLFVAKRPEVAP